MIPSHVETAVVLLVVALALIVGILAGRFAHAQEMGCFPTPAKASPATAPRPKAWT